MLKRLVCETLLSDNEERPRNGRMAGSGRHPRRTAEVSAVLCRYTRGMRIWTLHACCNISKSGFGLLVPRRTARFGRAV
jgi:hypothetical protein